MRINIFRLILLIIFFFGLFLRIYNLENESLELDEGYSIRLAKLNLIKIIEGTAQDVHPPLYYLILHYWIKLFGDSEFATRMLSVIFGSLIIFMMYQVGSHIFNKKIGILGSLLVAFSQFHIHLSQEVRGYSMMALLTLLSVYFFIHLLKRGNFLSSLGYILSNLLLIYTHYYGLFILLVLNIYYIFFVAKDDRNFKIHYKKWILLQGILILLFLPWAIILFNQFLRIKRGFWIPKPSVTFIIWSFHEYAGSTLLLFSFLFILTSFPTVIYEKVRNIFKQKKTLKTIENTPPHSKYFESKNNYLLWMWLLIPSAIPFIISHIWSPIFLPKYTVSASLAFYLLIAKGIVKIYNKIIRFTTIGIVILLSLINISNYYKEINREQWREVAKYIEINAQPGDLLLFNESYCIDNIFDYYSKRQDLIRKSFSPNLLNTNEKGIEELMANGSSHNRIWIILRYGRDSDKLAIKKVFSRFYNISYYKKYFGIELFLLEKSIK